MEAMEKYRAPQPDAEEQRRRQAAENALFRVDVRRSLRLYRHVAIYTGGAVFALLLLMALLAHKRYSAEAFLSVSPSVPHVMGETQQNYAQDSLTYDNLIEQQMQLVRSYEVLAKTINSPGILWREPKESEQAAVDRLAKAVTVTRVEKSYQIALVVTAKDAAQAALIANTIAQNYLASSNAESSREDAERLTALRAERAQLQAALDAKIAQQSALLQKLKIAPGSTAALDSEFTTLSAAAADAKVKHDAAVARLQALSIQGADAGSVNDPLQNQMNGPNSLAEKRATLVAQMAGLTPNHPLYKEDAAEIKQIDAQIAADSNKAKGTQLQRAQAQARTELASATTQQAMLSGQLAAEAARVSKNTPDLEQSNAIATEIKRLEDRYGLVDDRVRNLELEGQNPGFVQLTSQARPALHPNPNKRMLFLLLLLPGSLCAGIFAAIVALRLDPKIYSGADIEAITGHPPLAVLLHSKEASPEVMEEYLLRMAAGVESLHTTRNVHTLLVTGTSAETGASTLATALALKLQQVNRDSAVIDAEAQTAVSHDDLRHLASQHGLVLVDAPPILSSARAEYLARFTDSVLLITESGRTTRDELKRAMKLLDKLQVGGVAVVLNKLTLASAEDQVQREVAELEQRILERGTTGYTKPALRLFNTAPAERAAKNGASATVHLPEVVQLPEPEVAAEQTAADEPVDAPAEIASAAEALPAPASHSADHFAASTPAHDLPFAVAAPVPVAVAAAEPAVAKPQPHFGTQIRASERLAQRLAERAARLDSAAEASPAPFEFAAQPEAVAEPEAEHAPELYAVEPVAATFEPVAEPAAEFAEPEPAAPAVEAYAEESATTIATEPVFEHVPEPFFEAAAEPVAEPVADAAIEPASEAAFEPAFEQQEEPIAEPEAATVAQHAEKTFVPLHADPATPPPAAPAFLPAGFFKAQANVPAVAKLDKPVIQQMEEELDALTASAAGNSFVAHALREADFTPVLAAPAARTDKPTARWATPDAIADATVDAPADSPSTKVTFFGAPPATVSPVVKPNASSTELEPLVPLEFAKAPAAPGSPITFGKRPSVQAAPAAKAEAPHAAREEELPTLPEKDGYKEFPDSGNKLFGFNWKRRPLVAEAEEPHAQPAVASAQPETIEPFTPSVATTTAPETYVPVPSKATNGAGKKVGWMDRAEIERLIGKRKD